MSHLPRAKSAYHHIRPFVEGYRPAAIRRKTLIAWARRRGKPVADSMPGLRQKMWIGPGEYYTYFYSTQQVVEPGVLAFLRRHVTPGMTVFDIGANVGYMTLFCAGLVGKNGNIIAFEPGQRAYERLLANVRLNNLHNVISVQAALSDIDGYETYCQAVHRGEDVYNSLLSVDTPWTFAEDFRETRIPVHRLDTLMEKTGWPAPSVVKVDVEGAERKVLRGMSETLRAGRTRILVLEISNLYCNKFGYSPRELVEDLKHRGFVCWAIEETGNLCALDLEDNTCRSGMMAAMRG